VKNAMLIPGMKRSAVDIEREESSEKLELIKTAMKTCRNYVFYTTFSEVTQ
jgi:hypothetical protein